MTLQAGAGQGGWDPTGKLSPCPGDGQDTDALSKVVEPSPAPGSAHTSPHPLGSRTPQNLRGRGKGGSEEDSSGDLPPCPARLAAAQNFLQKERAPGDETAQPHPSGSVETAAAT